MRIYVYRKKKIYIDFASISLTIMSDPLWNCPLCSWFGGLSLKTVLRHVGRVHSHVANFHICCGINGCPRTFRKFVSYRQHLYRHHRETLSGPTLAAAVSENDRYEGKDNLTCTL